MFPLVHTALAQTFSKVAANPTVNSYATRIGNAIVMPLLELLFAATIFYFIYGVLGLIKGEVDSDEHNDAKRHVLYGTIGIFIMITAFGIIRLIGNTVGVGDPFQ